MIGQLWHPPQQIGQGAQQVLEAPGSRRLTIPAFKTQSGQQNSSAGIARAHRFTGSFPARIVRQGLRENRRDAEASRKRQLRAPRMIPRGIPVPASAGAPHRRHGCHLHPSDDHRAARDHSRVWAAILATMALAWSVDRHRSWSSPTFSRICGLQEIAGFWRVPDWDLPGPARG